MDLGVAAGPQLPLDLLAGHVRRLLVGLGEAQAGQRQTAVCEAYRSAPVPGRTEGGQLLADGGRGHLFGPRVHVLL